MSKLTEYVKEMDVLKEWPMSKATLIRERKKGLPFVRLGAFVCYEKKLLEDWFSKPRSWKAATPKGEEGKHES